MICGTTWLRQPRRRQERTVTTTAIDSGIDLTILNVAMRYNLGEEDDVVTPKRVRKMLTLVYLDREDMALLRKITADCWYGTITEALVQCIRVSLESLERHPRMYRRHLRDSTRDFADGVPFAVRVDEREKNAIRSIQSITKRDSVADTIRLAIRIGGEVFLPT